MSAPDPFKLVREIQGRGLAPVHLWDPPFCGDIDMRIGRDGTWYHEGQAIRRIAMVKLFASILKKEGDSDYFLVTPVEKVGIQVDDCPFLITQLSVDGKGEEQSIKLTTNTDETFRLDSSHRLNVETLAKGEPHPVVHVRSGLNGLLTRSVFYQLVELAIERSEGLSEQLGIWSYGEFFVLS